MLNVVETWSILIGLKSRMKTWRLNAFDFGDLILFCVKLFEEHKDIREIYQKNFKYI